MAGLEWIQALLDKEADLTGLTVHLKIDSGMGRIGFREAGEAEQAQDLLRQHGARVEGIFTHFATADEEADDYFNAQLERYQIIRQVQDRSARIQTIHGISHTNRIKNSLCMPKSRCRIAGMNQLWNFFHTGQK